MSHLTSIKTELRYLDTIQAALRRLGLEFQLGGTIEDYYHNVVEVDVSFNLPGQRPIGFVHDTQTGVFNLVGDWYGGKTTEKEFLDSLKSHYAREQVYESLEQQGVDVSKMKEIEEPDGSVVFELPIEEDEMEALVTA